REALLHGGQSVPAQVVVQDRPVERLVESDDRHAPRGCLEQVGGDLVEGGLRVLPIGLDHGVGDAVDFGGLRRDRDLRVDQPREDTVRSVTAADDDRRGDDAVFERVRPGGLRVPAEPAGVEVLHSAPPATSRAVSQPSQLSTPAASRADSHASRSRSSATSRRSFSSSPVSWPSSAAPVVMAGGTAAPRRPSRHASAMAALPASGTVSRVYAARPCIVTPGTSWMTPVSGSAHSAVPAAVSASRIFFWKPGWTEVTNSRLISPA